MILQQHYNQMQLSALGWNCTNLYTSIAASVMACVLACFGLVDSCIDSNLTVTGQITPSCWFWYVELIRQLELLDFPNKLTVNAYGREKNIKSLSLQSLDLTTGVAAVFMGVKLRDFEHRIEKFRTCPLAPAQCYNS